jgi:hypothetical protein
VFALVPVRTVSIVFSVPGSSGSGSARSVMAGLDHAPHRVATVSSSLIHRAAVLPA